MAGKICMGNDRVPNDPALSRAYCTGRGDRVHGGGVTPSENYKNPHPVVDAAAHNAYNRGFLSAVIIPTAFGERDCCADIPSTTDLLVPDVVGQAAGSANYILLTNGFNPVPANQLTGLVVSQDPIAGASALSGSDVTYVAS